MKSLGRGLGGRGARRGRPLRSATVVMCPQMSEYRGSLIDRLLVYWKVEADVFVSRSDGNSFFQTSVKSANLDR